MHLVPLFSLFYWGKLKWLRACSAMSHVLTKNCKAQQHQRQETYFRMLSYEMKILMCIAIKRARRLKKVHVNSLTGKFEVDLKCRFSRRILQSEQILTIAWGVRAESPFTLLLSGSQNYFAQMTWRICWESNSLVPNNHWQCYKKAQLFIESMPLTTLSLSSPLSCSCFTKSSKSWRMVESVIIRVE